MGRVSLWKKIQREELKTGDHIYTLRGADTKVHHGIYVNDTNVIHFCRGACSDDTCPTCGDFYEVASYCLDCFLYGGDLYRFVYGVNPAHFLAKFGRGCTLASTDKAEDVVDRASFFLDYGSCAYHRYINNGEDFAVYCKTGLLVVDMINFSRTWQIAYFLAVTAAVFLSLQQLMLISFTGLAARFLGLCCICIFASDIGARPNVIKLSKVHRLPEVDQILSYGGSGFQLMESYFDVFIQGLMVLYPLCMLPNIFDPNRWSRPLLLVRTQASVLFFFWAVLQRRLLSNKIQKEQLRRGDHIYTWRNGFTYAHHGIYVGDGIGHNVIHLVRGEDPILPSGSSSSRSLPSDSSINTGGNLSMPLHCRVEYCSIDSFLDGGELYIYKYGVNYAFLLAKIRGGTCTTIPADPPKYVANRARFLQYYNCFGAYNLFNNNCEDFALYCKTALLSQKGLFDFGKTGQITSLHSVYFAIICFVALLSPLRQIIYASWNGQVLQSLLGILAVFYNNFIDAATTVFFLYCIKRFVSEVSFNNNGFKVPVQRMTTYSRSADWFGSNFCHFILST